MNLTRFAIEKRVVTVIVTVVIFVGGGIAWNALPRAEDPGFPIRVALIFTIFPGASPERVELLVTDKIEKAIQEMPEIEDIRSESRTGVSIIFAHIQERYTTLRPIWDSLRRKVDKARAELPDSVIGPKVEDEFGDVFGIVMTLRSDGFSYAELKRVADDVRDAFLQLDEVAKVDIFGAQEERVFIEFDHARMAELGVSATHMKFLLEGTNIIIPGGDVTVGSERIILEPSGSYESIADLENTMLGIPGVPGAVRLGDIAVVRRGYIEPPRTRMHYNGDPCLGIAVSMREGGNILRLGDDVRALYDDLKANYPIGIELDFVAFQPDRVQAIVRQLNQNLLQSLVVIVLIMLVFLGLRTGLVVAAAIPGSVIMTYLCMYALEIGMDQLSIASIIIALGMIVDNAIVIAESIMVQMASGKRPVNAAIDSARELQVPLLTSSLITCAAFLPIYLAESTTGEYCASLFKVVSLTLVCSWVLALTLTPMLCVRFLRPKPYAGGNPYASRAYARYRAFVLTLLRHPRTVLTVTTVVFLVSMLGFRFVPVIFFPPSDRAGFILELEGPNGTAIERIEQAVQEVEDFITRELKTGPGRPRGIVDWASYVGEGGPRFILTYEPTPMRSEYAVSVLNITDYTEFWQLSDKIEAFCRKQLPDIKVTQKLIPLGPPSKAPVEVRLSTNDMTALYELVDDVRERLGSIPGVRRIDEDWGSWQKKLYVDIDQARAHRAGVLSQDIAVSLLTMLSGFDVTEFREEDKVIPVTLRSEAATHTDLSRLETLPVYAQLTGQNVPLKQVADIRAEWEPALIKRLNRLRTVTVAAYLDEGVTAHEVNKTLVPWLQAESEVWPRGARFEIGGDSEQSDKANASIIAKLPHAALAILLLLAIEFNSVRRITITMLTLPLGLVGVVVGLLLTQSYFGFMTFLGIISMAGIVTKNAIVLIERIDLERYEFQRTPQQAIVEACQRRLRPIFLTSATTILGLMPLWLASTPLWPPMAVSIIFGLLLGTVLTLGIVPVLYAVFFRISFKGYHYEPAPADAAGSGL